MNAVNIFLEREPPNGSRAHPNYPLRQAVLRLQCGLTIGAPSFLEGTFRVGKYPLRPCELVVGVPGPDFVHLENIQVGNVQCLVSPIDAHVFGPASLHHALDLPSVPARRGMTITVRLRYTGVPNSWTSPAVTYPPGVTFPLHAWLRGWESVAARTDYGRRMQRKNLGIREEPKAARVAHQHFLQNLKSRRAALP
jgi:hypothetical protein